ncbi:diaminobutyrate--2-oxoglutarate transaminase [Mycobacteroides abscessus]|uniref:diaminobutyrate--2-oxoglutarate transaminase n=1 Tax=Mycobacteroides abscessus TaxID=36809 RepID=UPI000C26181B|nr:diaminobutyrate--2-oxoglutarate transaminase [Mycobacteroides abscessus]PVA97614.1 diaminobutyrate--2-oxoglutarate transaminase [Mycobacteroides abscessus]QOF34632.1 diaminobutyrate-2-oxoglutarate aminotransferase [Mycobacteroides abscessus]
MTATLAAAGVANPIESEVRSYSRMWPETFVRAKGSKVWSKEREFLDFFAAAGSLNYGHNDPDAQRALTEYIASDGILQALDMQTTAREQFLETLHRIILRPRRLDHYRVMFTGPTGTNAVEAALKCARLATGRSEVISFLQGFHGVTLGSLAATSNALKRQGAGVTLNNASRFPFDFEGVEAQESVGWFERVHFSSRRTSELPACVLMELIQGEGGVNVARADWAQGVAAVCKKYDVPLIVDEIQMGCGRTGPFFAFEDYGLIPDIVTVSKSLSGLGLPLAVVLLNPELDLVVPGQHNGTFRGNNAAFVTATALLEKYWANDALCEQTLRKSQLVLSLLNDTGVSDAFTVRGKGLVIGVDMVNGERAGRVLRECFDEGILIETAGADDQVVKLLPPLTMEESEITRGVKKIASALMRSF